MSFAADLGRFRRSTKDRLDRVRRVVVIKLFSAVVQDTPVLTGRLRGNWRVSIGSPLSGSIDRLDPTGAQVGTEIQAIAADSAGADAVWMTNSLPYAARIEYDGWSKKAPEGMMRRNVARFQRLVDEAVRTGKL
jgi:hypothetical protein